MTRDKDLKILAKIRLLCDRYEAGGWDAWQNDLYLNDLEELVDRCKIKNKEVKRIKELIKEYYEQLGRKSTEPSDNGEDTEYFDKIVEEGKKIKIPASYVVVEKLKNVE